MVFKAFLVKELCEIFLNALKYMGIYDAAPSECLRKNCYIKLFQKSKLNQRNNFAIQTFRKLKVYYFWK